MENRRRSYRIKYREEDMPLIEIAKKPYKIIDISTIGVKFRSTDFEKNQSLEGKIYLHTDNPLTFEGKVVRVNERFNCTAVEFYKELNLSCNERNYLKNEKGYKI